MKRRVLLTPQAKQDIQSAYLYTRTDAPEAARRWRPRLMELVKSLSVLPIQHEIAAKAREVGVELRQMPYGDYRILYTIDTDGVRIHALRHGARRPSRPDELPGGGASP